MSRAAAIPAPPETVAVEDSHVACDGGGGALGHPLVYLTMREDGTVECPYCDRKYVLKGGHGH